MNSVGAGLARDEGTVVDDQQRADPLAQRAHRFGDRHELVVGQVLLAQLHDVHPAGQRRVDERGKVGAQAGAQVQAGLREPPSDLRSIQAGHKTQLMR